MYRMNYQNILIVIISSTIISGVLGILIAIISKYFNAKDNTSVEEVEKLLPGYNCGGCGKPGCKSFAHSIINENNDIDKCKPLKKEQKEKIINLLKKNK